MDERAWFELQYEEIVALPTDELALRILKQMGPGSETRVNATGRIHRERDQAPRDAQRAVVEAWWWLVRKGLITPEPKNSDDLWWIATRAGEAAQHEGEISLSRIRAGERLDLDLHPRIADDVRSDFLRGKFEVAVFTAMREVEIAIREASGATEDAYGQQLLGHAFGKDGVLIDSNSASAEDQGVAFLFRGAIGALKNPHSHRRIDFDDPTEAAEIVLFASLLLRIVDRLSEPAPQSGSDISDQEGRE